jgi:hypothetical protein
MLASEFFNERVRLRAQGKLPPGDPIVYDARDTPQNRARFKAFNEYVLNYGQNLEDDFAESRRAELPDEEDGGDYAASKPSNQSTRIKSHVSKGGKYGSIKGRLFTNNTRGGKSIGDVSTGRVDPSEYCTGQTVAAVGQYEEDSDTIVVDCGEGMEERLSARRRNNMRQPTARQIHQQLNKTSPRKNSQNSEVTAKIGKLHHGRGQVKSLLILIPFSDHSDQTRVKLRSREETKWQCGIGRMWLRGVCGGVSSKFPGL